ncbi:hypothetical protein CHS0354_032346 [Potamilus streckersoni]|uniref:TIR domain-containing protein n=1 Tax=Potamilus streckersoni TaxID=2493646 RepID=A0AAE0TGW5_9BIVA|nr:hypothetical protein CHS0354_032346 [Potamilus streckersoni]
MSGHKPARNVSVIQTKNSQVLLKNHPELKTVLKSFDQAISILGQQEKWKEDCNETYFREVQNTLKQNLLDNFKNFNDEEQKLVMGKDLVDKGFPKLLFEFYECVVEEADIKAFNNELADEAFNGDETLSVIVTLREIFWNFTDGCPVFSKAVSETGLFKHLVNDLSAIKSDGLEVLEENPLRFAFNSAVAILHNCARNLDMDRRIFRDVKAVDHLLPFLESKLPQIQMVTLLALADMIDDNECDKIHRGENVFKFLKDMIKEACQAPDRRKEGFCVSELIDGLSGLAKAEKNKTLIMDTKPLGIFSKVLEDGHEKELLSVCHVVRELAFNHNNIEKIKGEKLLCSKLNQLQTHQNKKISEIAKGVIFQLKVDVSTTARTRKTPSGTDVDKVVSTPQGKPFAKRVSRGELPWTGPHIMISYNWDNQQEIIKIRDYLVKQGYNVWLDVDHMHTYMLEAMAEAVEQAFVVLVCFTEKYKNSPNCRLEAEYAFLLKKEIIPLKMQNGYSADGWLGILLCSKLYYEFTGNFEFDNTLEKLCNAIDQLPNNPKYDDLKKKDKPELHQQRSEIQMLPPPPPPVAENLTKEEVDQWLRKSQLDLTRLKKLKSLTGEQLVFLKKVSTKAPEFFFHCLERRLSVDNLEDVMNLSNGLENLAL